jgi:hypothetical protein
MRLRLPRRTAKWRAVEPSCGTGGGIAAERTGGVVKGVAAYMCGACGGGAYNVGWARAALKRSLCVCSE